MTDSASGTLADAQLSDRLRARGWRITPQRRAILSALAGEQVHLSAEQVHAAARRTVPEVSLATVYNTLNELVRLAEVSEIHLADGSARYDPKVGPEHHHLVCEGCGLMFDVEPFGVSGLSLPLAQRFGMTVDSVEVVFRGRCSRCAEQSGTVGVGPDWQGVEPS
jgi:Fur family transcriptional regulator, stress-responsive regulator